MKITVELTVGDPMTDAVLQVLLGGKTPAKVNAPGASKEMAEDIQKAVDKKADMAKALAAEAAKAEAKAEKARLAELAAGEAEAAKAAKAAQETTSDDEDGDTPSEPEEPKKPATPAGSGKITLASLQDLASALLQAGERRTFKALLDEANVKSLSTAEESDYPALFESLTEAVSNLAAS